MLFRSTIPSINYFGGEPLLRWDDIIVPLTKYIRKTYGDKYTLSMTTNGILLDRTKLEFMKEHKIGFLFSMDGDKKTQDLNRPFHNGKGSFDILKKKIPMFLEYEPNATFRATIDNDNVRDVANNYQFAIDMGYTNVFMIPNVFTKWSKKQRNILKSELKKVADIYMDSVRKNKVVKFNQFTDAFKNIKKINRASAKNEHRNINTNSPAFGTCGLGGSRFGSVGPNGDIYSCQELVENPSFGDKFTIGNIYTGMDNKKRWEVMEKFNPKEVRSTEGKVCSECYLNDSCDGVCTINNYLANGDVNIISSILCDFYEFNIQQAIRIINTMAEEKNETFRNIFNGV